MYRIYCKCTRMLKHVNLAVYYKRTFKYKLVVTHKQKEKKKKRTKRKKGRASPRKVVVMINHEK